MTQRVVSIYYPGYRMHVLVDDQWYLLGGVQNLRLLIWGVKPADKLVLNTKMLPLNRFTVIKKANEKLIKLLICTWLRNQKSPEILWIHDPGYFDVHNKISSRYLVFSCEPKCLVDRDRYIRYRECFEAGWTFAYRVRDDCQFWVFKKISETNIVKKLLKNRG